MRESFITLMVVMLMASCIRGEAMDPEDDANPVTEISVVTEPLVVAGSVTRADDTGKDTIEDMTVGNRFIDGESLLYISQMGTTINPNFTGNTSDNELYNNNLYCYVYDENPSDWNSGYNFKVKEGRAPIGWGDIKKRGSVGNAFSLYALHFPVENEVRFNVEKNQQNLDNFRKSDIMGAYHATSSLYSRMRFRLYHLMVYLRVTLYVPDYQAAEADGKSQSTGFPAGAVKNAFLQGVATDFDITWRVNRSSDTDAPFVVGSETKTDYVFMYPHASDKDEIKTINVKEFYSQGNIDEDNVREYNFSVLIPPQTIGNADQFMRFQLLPVGSGTDDAGFDKDNTKLKNYVFQTSQLMSGSNDIQLTQGSLSHLKLYLPRKGNDVILVSAEIIDWTEASSDMTVTKKEK